MLRIGISLADGLSLALDPVARAGGMVGSSLDIASQFIPVHTESIIRLRRGRGVKL